jgi:hypothetical protein
LAYKALKTTSAASGGKLKERLVSCVRPPKTMHRVLARLAKKEKKLQHESARLALDLTGQYTASFLRHYRLRFADERELRHQAPGVSPAASHDSHKAMHVGRETSNPTDTTAEAHWKCIC